MIDFKESEIKSSDLARVNELQTYPNSFQENANDDDEEGNLYIPLHRLSNYTEIKPIVQGLYSNSKEIIIKSFEELDIICNFEGNLEQLTEDDVRQILFLSDLNQLVEKKKDNFGNTEITEIRKKALESLFLIINKMKIKQISIEIFTQFEICPMIVHQLPDLHVPLILDLLLDYQSEFVGQILSEIEFIMDKLKTYHERKYIEIYSVIQVIFLLFKYQTFFEMGPIVTKINDYCWKNQHLMDTDYLKLFYFDFLSRIKSNEFFRILSTTNFFTNSTSHFTTLCIFNYKTEIFDKYIDNYNLNSTYLNQAGMTTDFHSESIRQNVLEIIINYIENGYLEQFIDTCFPDLFNNYANSVTANDDYNKRLYNLSYVIRIVFHVIGSSEKNRSILINSNFNKMMTSISSFNEKELVLLYVSFFVPYELDKIEYLDNLFKIVDLCSDIIFSGNVDSIIAAVNVFSLILTVDQSKFELPLCQNLINTLLNEDIFDLLEDIATSFEVEDTATKAQNLITFIKRMTEPEE